MAEKNNKKEEEFDFITPYLEKIGLEEKEERKGKEEKDHKEHFEISTKEVVKHGIEIIKKEKRMTAIVAVEIALTIILILMLAGVIPFF